MRLKNLWPEINFHIWNNFSCVYWSHTGACIQITKQQLQGCYNVILWWERSDFLVPVSAKFNYVGNGDAGSGNKAQSIWIVHPNVVYFCYSLPMRLLHHFALMVKLRDGLIISCFLWDEIEDMLTLITFKLFGQRSVVQ